MPNVFSVLQHLVRAGKDVGVPTLISFLTVATIASLAFYFLRQSAQDAQMVKIQFSIRPSYIDCDLLSAKYSHVRQNLIAAI